MRALEERPALAFRRREEAVALEASGGAVEDDDLARRQQRKDAKLLLEASRPLDPWERYRALVDAFEQGIDLAEMADRKVRFALLVMALLNIAVFALSTHSELLGFGPFQLRGWLGAYLLVYAIVAVYFFIQAVDALRPRAGTPPARRRPSFEASRLRHLERVLSQDVATYAQAWRDVRFDQLHTSWRSRTTGWPRSTRRSTRRSAASTAACACWRCCSPASSSSRALPPCSRRCWARR